MKKNILNILSLISISLLIMGNVQAQQWKIDDDLKDARLKIPYDETNIDAGKLIYEKSCKACHRDIVIVDKNDRDLPSAPNLGNKEFQTNNTDGEIFCKISHGNGAGMPPFESQISEEQRWQVIAFLRSFSDTWEAPDASAAPVADKADEFNGQIKAISTSYDSKNNSIVAKVEAIDSEGNTVYPKGVKVKISIQRGFGNLPICDGEKTDDNGLVSISLNNLPPDTAGFIKVYAQVGDGVVKSEADLKISDGWKWENPLDGHHLWGTRDKTPIWLLITYLTVTISVLLIIGWAFFQLARIYNLRER